MGRLNKLQETFGILYIMAEKAGRPPIPDKEWLTTEPEVIRMNWLVKQPELTRMRLL